MYDCMTGTDITRPGVLKLIERHVLARVYMRQRHMGELIQVRQVYQKYLYIRFLSFFLFFLLYSQLMLLYSHCPQVAWQTYWPHAKVSDYLWLWPEIVHIWVKKMLASHCQRQGCVQTSIFWMHAQMWQPVECGELNQLSFDKKKNPSTGLKSGSPSLNSDLFPWHLSAHIFSLHYPCSTQCG